MPRLRRGVELSEYELAVLAGELTAEQRYALIDAGWVDLRDAVDFAMRRLPELRQLWGARLEQMPAGIADGWLRSFALMFWGEAVPLLVANPPEPDLPASGTPAQLRDEGGSPDAETAPREADGRAPGEIPFDLVEKAVQQHIETGAGRRALAVEIPGLTDWMAREILRWYNKRELWLDEHGRLRWGPAITPIWEAGAAPGAGPGAAGATVSPTPVALRLPRI